MGDAMVHEPVLASGVYVNGEATNILYGGSGKGSTMYAINATTGGIVWQMAVPQCRLPLLPHKSDLLDRRHPGNRPRGRTCCTSATGITKCTPSISPPVKRPMAGR